MIRKCLAAAIFVLAVLPGTSLAQMYKCTGPNGEITFTKHGCATDNDTAKIGYTDLMVDGAPSPHQSDTTLRWLIDRLRS